MKSGCWVSMCSRVPRFDGSRDSLEPPVFSGDSPVNRGFEKAASFSILPNLFPYWSKDLIFICLQVIFFLKALYDYPRKKGGGGGKEGGESGEKQNVKCQGELPVTAAFYSFFLLTCRFWGFFASMNFPSTSLSFLATSDLRTVFHTFDEWSDQFLFRQCVFGLE